MKKKIFEIATALKYLKPKYGFCSKKLFYIIFFKLPRGIPSSGVSRLDLDKRLASETQLETS